MAIYDMAAHGTVSGMLLLLLAVNDAAAIFSVFILSVSWVP